MARGSKPGERRGGRQKGTPNKRTIRDRDALVAYLEQAAQADPMAHPVRLLVSVMTSRTAVTSERVHAATALLDRILPKLKAVEISGDPDKPLTLTDATARQARYRRVAGAKEWPRWP